MPVFQPAEETGDGAQAMIDDGLFKRFPKPTAIFGQHVMVGSSGVVSTRAGVITSAGDSLQIRTVWSRSSRLDASIEYRSGCYGRCNRASPADYCVA